MQKLRETDDIHARRLEFCILTGTRTNETVGARWTEMDLEAGIWEIPVERLLKDQNREFPYRVPLVGRALEIVKSMPRDREYVFYETAPHKRRLLNTNDFLGKLGDWRDKDGRPITVHGFRGTLKTLASEATTFHAKLRKWP